jgi:hypothetical protein
MAVVSDQFLTGLLRQIGRMGVFRARKVIPSKTLKQAVFFREDTPTSGGVYIPHYWAVYLHDGHGRVYPKGGKFLVWFRDSKDDPRLPSGYTPERYAQTQHLTRAAFERGLADNKRARELGMPEPMIVRKSSGPAPSTDFFSNEKGFKGFSRNVNDALNGEVLDHIRELLGPDVFKVKKDKAVLVIGK